MAEDDLEWLTRWYLAQCDEDWEHQFGVTIETLDNPGWSLAIDLEGTPLQERPFQPIQENVGEEQLVQGPGGDRYWFVCRREGLRFVGHAGPRDLGHLIRIFREWATATGAEH